MPLAARLLGLFALGALVGSLINWAIYQLAWIPTTKSPWSQPQHNHPPRGWNDRIPIFGWLSLRRETTIHGSGFWIRPLLIELAMGLGIAWLYLWEVVDRELYTQLYTQQLANLVGVTNVAAIVIPSSALFLPFWSHVLLVALMVVASFIDVDEKVIPDGVTVTGTVAGLAMAAALPWSLLPTITVSPVPPAFAVPLETVGGQPMQLAGQPLARQFLTITSPRDWPAALDGSPNLRSLAIALGCYWFWIFAILPRRHRIWYRRRGLRGAVRLLLGQVRLSFAVPYICFLAAAGTLGVAGTWWLGGEHWAGLLTALVGLVGGGAIVWAVRIIGSVTLRKEAMGFGDVTLMMMIGTYIGWQASLIVFFLAPFAGLILGLIRLIFWRDHEIPYGPFLCLATVVLVVRWGDIWSWAQGMFDMPWLVPMAIAVCLVAMMLLLAGWRMIAFTLLGRSR